MPLVEDAAHARLRSPQAVARRAIVLYGLAAIGHDANKAQVVNSWKEAGVRTDLSPSERAFVEAESVTKQERANATWRVEALWVLLWALGLIDTLAFPDQPCDVDRIHSLIPKPHEANSFIESAKLRDVEGILDETDKIYRIHWAVREAQLKSAVAPAELDAGVVEERHYALNWLTWYADDWDEITTDT
ncbi:MAG: DUF4272 domain-containing protein [Pyrinomonadaceae bacterium]